MRFGADLLNQNKDSLCKTRDHEDIIDCANVVKNLWQEIDYYWNTQKKGSEDALLRLQIFAVHVQVLGKELPNKILSHLHHSGHRESNPLLMDLP